MKRAFSTAAKATGVLLVLPYALFVLAIPARGLGGAGLFAPVAFPVLFPLMFLRGNVHNVSESDILIATAPAIVFWWVVLGLVIRAVTKPTRLTESKGPEE